jgi:hypothetical protein
MREAARYFEDPPFDRRAAFERGRA